MTQSRKTWLSLALAAGGAVATAFAPGAAQAAATPASPDGEFGALGTCGQAFSADVRDNVRVVGRAHWDVICRWSGSEWFVYLEGWVDDIAADGKCVWVRGERFAGDPNTQLAKDCPADGPRTDFTFKFPGRNANGYAYVD
jgi:hypothetical protein